MAEASRLPEAEQERIGRELLAELERLRVGQPSERRGPRPISAADLERLAAFRATLPFASVDAGTLVSQMRDDDWR